MLEAPSAQTNKQWVRESWCSLVKQATFLNLAFLVVCVASGQQRLFHVALSRTVSHEQRELCIISYRPFLKISRRFAFAAAMFCFRI